MKRSRRIKRGYALALACILALPGLSLLRTQAAGTINTEAKCSLTVTVEGSEYAADFNEMSIPVSVYRVADVDSTGHYTAEAPFSAVDFGSVGSKTTANDWMKLAGQAETIRKSANPKAAGSVTVQKAAGSTVAAKGTITGLDTGMYLVVPADTYNKDYSVKYTFTPYLTALPNNPYASSGNYGQGPDEWDYNPAIGLKAAGEPQKGKLIITKILTNYNETLGKTSFVFEVTGRDSTGKLVYSNVVSTTHEGPGEQSITLEGLPAGITVTVKEVYSGASYELDGAGQADAFIWSDAAVDAKLGQTASVTFKNKYDGGNRGGYGVTNHFTSDGKNGWTWENPTSGLPRESN